MKTIVISLFAIICLAIFGMLGFSAYRYITVENMAAKASTTSEKAEALAARKSVWTVDTIITEVINEVELSDAPIEDYTQTVRLISERDDTLEHRFHVYPGNPDRYLIFWLELCIGSRIQFEFRPAAENATLTDHLIPRLTRWSVRRSPVL